MRLTRAWFIPTLLFIKDIEDFADEFATGIVTDVLRNRDKFHASLAQLSDVETEWRESLLNRLKEWIGASYAPRDR